MEIIPFSVSLIHLTDSKDTWNEIKLAGIKEYFHKQYPGLEIHYDVVMNDNLLKGLDQYIKDNHIDIITLTSYKGIYLLDYLIQVLPEK